MHHPDRGNALTCGSLKLTALAVVALLGATAADAFVLVMDGRARAKLVVLAETEDPRYTTRVDGSLERGIEDFCHYIERISGARVQRVATLEEAGSPRILVEKIGPRDGLSKDGAGVSVGADGITIRAWHDEGLGNGLVTLLDDLGVRWYWPGETGELVPTMGTIAFPDGDRTVQPSYVSRYGVTSGRSRDPAWNRAVVDWSRRNRAGGWYWHGSGHSYQYLVRRSRFADHPESFALVDGRRDPVNLCVTHPEVARIAARTAIGWEGRKEREIVCVSPPDGRVKCTCERCRALDVAATGRSDRVAWFANRVVRRLNRQFPDARAMYYCYVDYQKAPAREKPDPNVIGMFVLWAGSTGMRHDYAMVDPVNGRARDLFLGCAGAFDLLGVHPYYGHYRWFTYWPQVENMRKDIPWWWRRGARIFYSETHQHWPTQHLNFFFMYRLTWDVATDVDAELERYCSAFLGPAGPPVRQFNALMLEAFRSAGPVSGNFYADVQRYTPAVLGKARALMDEATAASVASGVDPMYARRVAFLAKGLAMTELWTTGVRAMQRFGQRRDPADREKTAQAFQALYDMTTAAGNAGLVEAPERKGINVPESFVKPVLERMAKPGTLLPNGRFTYGDTMDGGGKALFDARTIERVRPSTYGFTLAAGASGVLEWEFTATEGTFQEAVLGINDPVERNHGRYDVRLSVDGGTTWVRLPFEEATGKTKKGAARLLGITDVVRGARSFLLRIETTNATGQEKLILDWLHLSGEIR